MNKLQDSSSERTISIALVLFFMVIQGLFIPSVKAQHSFSALKGAFVPLTDGKPVNSIQKYSSISGTLDLGFTFKFNGLPYDKIKASASGFITFKKAAKWNEMDSSVIAPLGYNALSGEKGNASYKTEGTAPNRVFTFEWLNWKWDWDAAQPGISFQVKLYETSNRIEFHYQKEVGALNNPIARIGLMYQYPAKCIFLSDASDNPQVNRNQVSYVYQAPANGQIYCFDELILPEPSDHVTGFVNDKSAGISLKWNDSRGINLPQRYLILVSDKGYEEIRMPEDGKEMESDLNLKDGDGVAYVDYGIQKYTDFTELKKNSTYFFKIFPVTNYFTYTNYKTDGNIAQLKVNTSIDLSTVEINIAESVLNNTSNDIQYSVNSTDGANGSWTDCAPIKTAVDFKNGGYDLWVRQGSNPTNNLKLGYILAPAKAPAFSINYSLSTTAEDVPGTVEYSLDAAMLSGLISGKNVPVELTPGSVVYFRVKATQALLPSAIQTLTVPARPEAPSFSIDYMNERTVQPVPSSVEYGSSINMGNVLFGKGEALNLVPGQPVYFRIKTTSTSFSSAIQTLVVPERPALPVFTIDYPAETTSQIVTADYEYAYSPDFSNSTTGQGVLLVVTPEKNLFIRRKASSNSFKSDVQNLLVPKRPIAPSQIILNDTANTFDWNFAGDFNKFSDYEYSLDKGNTWKTCGSKPGNVGNINVEKGALKLRIKATFSSFKGEGVVSETAFTSITGIPGLKDAGISFYPNPVEDILYLENLPENSTISILDLNGKIAVQKRTESKNLVISTTELSDGMFIIRVTTPKGHYQSRFTKM